jgi:hypothetical protein
MPTLVRLRLENMPSLARFHVLRPGLPEPKEVTKARKVHALADGEELIAVWQWQWRLLMLPDSLAFTSTGIRLSVEGGGIFLRYEHFHQYTFECGKEYRSSYSHYDGDHWSWQYNVRVSGPDVKWAGPYGFGEDGIVGLVDALKDIQRMITGGPLDQSAALR